MFEDKQYLIDELESEILEVTASLEELQEELDFCYDVLSDIGSTFEESGVIVDEGKLNEYSSKVDDLEKAIWEGKDYLSNLEDDLEIEMYSPF